MLKRPVLSCTGSDQPAVLSLARAHCYTSPSCSCLQNVTIRESTRYCAFCECISVHGHKSIYRKNAFNKVAVCEMTGCKISKPKMNMPNDKRVCVWCLWYMCGMCVFMCGMCAKFSFTYLICDFALHGFSYLWPTTDENIKCLKIPLRNSSWLFSHTIFTKISSCSAMMKQMTWVCPVHALCMWDPPLRP